MYSNRKSATSDEVKELEQAIKNSIEYAMCLPLLRVPFVLRKQRGINTFIPTSFNYFKVVNFMDSLLATNECFYRRGLPWHPLLSRLYFSFLFYYQTLRAMHHAGLGTFRLRASITQLLKDVPPERLPVPGPLIPILKAICTCNPNDDLYDAICPVIPEKIGVSEARQLMSLTDCTFLLPNMPVILAFIRMIIEPSDFKHSRFSDPLTFDDKEDRELNWYPLKANDWSDLARLTFLTPGLSEDMYTDKYIDNNFNRYGNALSLPFPISGDVNYQGPLNYMLLEQGTQWVHNVAEIMRDYCDFFKESSDLSHCLPHRSARPVVFSRMTKLVNANPEDNPVHTLHHAFPGTLPYEYEYVHESFEKDLDPVTAAMCQFAAINTSGNLPGTGLWSNFNTLDCGRSGPYWMQNPIYSRTREESCIVYEIQNIISSKYLIDNPDA